MAAHDVPTTLGLLDEAVDAAIVEERGLGRFAFRHPLFRAALYDHIGAGGRTAAHARIAVVLEAGPTVEPAVLAHHLGQSAPLGMRPPRRGMRSRRATRRWHVSPTRPRPGITDRHSTSPRTPSTVSWCGCGGPTPTPRRDATPARGPGTRRLAELTACRAAELARAALGGSGGAGMEVAPDATSRTLLERAFAAVDGSGPALRARLLARLSVVVAATAPPEQRAGLVAEAVALAEAAGDPLALADSAVARCHLHAGPDAVDQRLADAATVSATPPLAVRRASSCSADGWPSRPCSSAAASAQCGRAVDVYAERATLVRDPRYTYLGPALACLLGHRRRR